jgi:hypothetical protein
VCGRRRFGAINQVFVCAGFVRVELAARPWTQPHNQYEKAARGLSTKNSAVANTRKAL